MEFAGLEEEDNNDLHLPNPNAEKANSQHGNSLEVLLATKNKRIVEELTKLRVRRDFDLSLGNRLTFVLVLACWLFNA